MPEIATLKEVVAGLPLPTIALDRDEHIIASNQSACDLLGATLDSRHFITVLRQPAVVEAVEACMRRGKSTTARYHSSQGGQELVHDVTVAPVLGRFVLLSFEDVTDVTAAGKMRRDFIANVSHELRTPLTALMGFIDTLRGPARRDEAAQTRFLDIMTGEAERMNRLVGDLLSLSRVEEEARVKPTTQIDMRDVLALALRNLAPIAIEAEVTLHPNIPEEELMLAGDQDQLLQVFTNLIVNAIKYGGNGKTVRVTVNRIEHDPGLRCPSLRVVVSDEGPGIDPLHIPRLTERFYRVDSHRSRALGGTGLGLAIVKHIVGRHRGRLKIESELGQGSEFIVFLPALDESA